MGTVVRRAAAISLFGMSMVMASGGIASAGPNVVGMTYEKAKAQVSNWGLTATISTSTGGVLPQDDCIVVSGVMRPAPDGDQSRTMLLSLNCNAAVATATQAGSSVASPEGRKAKKQIATEKWRQTPDGQAWCAAAQQQHPDWDWSSIKGCDAT